MTALTLLLIALGPWLVVALPALLVELANPGFLFGSRPQPAARVRFVRPAQSWAVA